MTRNPDAWPIRRFRFDEEPGDDLSDCTTPEQRIAMMWPLAKEAWAVAGRAMPDYQRHNMPGRLFRPGEARPSDDEA